MPDTPKPIAPKREKTPAPKIDPKYLAAARELRDRYLEHVNASTGALLPAGKYDVARALSGQPRGNADSLSLVDVNKQLPAPKPNAA